MRRLHTYNDWKTTLGELSETIDGNKVVFTNGCFDILHPGHYQTLQRSKALGDILIVGLNTDDSVRRLKGASRPINTWQVRAEALSTLAAVDVVVGFAEDTPFELIKALRPAFITKGGDYTIHDMIGSDIVLSYGGEVIILPFLEGYSTTDILHQR